MQAHIELIQKNRTDVFIEDCGYETDPYFKGQVKRKIYLYFKFDHAIEYATIEYYQDKKTIETDFISNHFYSGDK